MADWTSGYVADIGYTYGYYRELNPNRLPLAFLSRGMAPPTIRTACELGYGQGISVNFHAASSSASWHGTDFNPAQVAFASELARASGASLNLADDAFEDYLKRTDLPNFDFIGLHGIWSWISEANRAFVVEFIRENLNPGGVVYVSYNTLPGWGNFAPVRHLLSEHRAHLSGNAMGLEHNIGNAVAFAERLLEHTPKFAACNPTAKARVEGLKEQNPHYLAHEYFNRDWTPLYFGEMAGTLSEARLRYVGSAHFLDQVDMLNLNEEQRDFLAELPDSTFRESVRDFMTNQSFRRDYWVKGGRSLSLLEQAEAVRNLRVVLCVSREKFKDKINTPLGEATMGEAYEHFFDALGSHKPKTLGELEDELGAKGVGLQQLFEVTMVLTSDGSVELAQSQEDIDATQDTSDSLNLVLFNKARSSNDIQHLTSPVTGGGVPCNRFEQLFIASARHGKKEPEEWAKEAWDILSGQGQQLVVDGIALSTPEENLAELVTRAQEFDRDRAAIMRALGIL